MQRSIQYLNKIFKLLNSDYFNNELPMPVISIQSSPKAYGHFTPWEAYRITDDKGDVHGAVEINIGAGTLDRPIENTVATLLHEMVHYYCYEKGIKDTSRRGQYHNKTFRDEATKRDLIIDYDPRIGWSITSPSENLIDWIIANQLEDIHLGRNEFTGFFIGGGAKAGNKGSDGSDGSAPVVPKKSNSHKLICPCCKTTVRYTTKVMPKIMCMECDEQFIEA